MLKWSSFFAIFRNEQKLLVTLQTEKSEEWRVKSEELAHADEGAEREGWIERNWKTPRSAWAPMKRKKWAKNKNNALRMKGKTEIMLRFLDRNYYNFDFRKWENALKGQKPIAQGNALGFYVMCSHAL